MVLLRIIHSVTYQIMEKNKVYDLKSFVACMLIWRIAYADKFFLARGGSILESSISLKVSTLLKLLNYGFLLNFPFTLTKKQRRLKNY